MGFHFPQFLSREGYAVDTACSGQDGIEKFRSGDYNLVMTDIKMPGMSGEEVLAEIRNPCPARWKNPFKITFHDNGAGLLDGIDIEIPGSMGLRTIVALTGHQLSGNVAVSRGNGTRFTITFQVNPDDASVQNG